MLAFDHRKKEGRNMSSLCLTNYVDNDVQTANTDSKKVECVPSR